METDTQQLNMEGKNRQTESYNTQRCRDTYTHTQAGSGRHEVHRSKLRQANKDRERKPTHSNRTNRNRPADSNRLTSKRKN